MKWQSLLLMPLMLPVIVGAEKLVFTLEKHTDYGEFTAMSMFTLLDNGHYSFETSTGGFRLCSGAPAGRFHGRLDQAQTETLLEAFNQVEEACKAIDACSSSGKRPGSYDYAVLGWGDYSNQAYFISGGTELPYLFRRVFELEGELYDEPERGLSLEIVDETADQIRLRAHYVGESPYPFAAGSWAFLLLGAGPARALPDSIYDPEDVKTLHSGDSTTMTLDKEQSGIEAGDYLVYAPARDLHPCVVVGEP